MQPGGLCFPSLSLLSGLFSLIVFWHHCFPGATTFPAQALCVWPPQPLTPPPHPKPSHSLCHALINLRPTCDTEPHYGHRSELKENGFGVLQPHEGFCQRFQHSAQEKVKCFLGISRKQMQQMWFPAQVQHLLPFLQPSVPPGAAVVNGTAPNKVGGVRHPKLPRSQQLSQGTGDTYQVRPEGSGWALREEQGTCKRSG